MAVILLFGVCIYVQPRELIRVLSSAQLWFLLPILVLRPLFYFVRGIRVWQILRIGSGVHLPVFETLWWFFVSCSIGVFTPGGLGDFSMAYFTRKFDVPISEGVGAILLDKIVSLFIIAMIALIGGSLYFDFDPILFSLVSSVVFMILFAIIFWKFSRFRKFGILNNDRSGFLPGFKLIFKFLAEHPYAFILNLLLCFAQSIIATLQIWLSLLMMNEHVHFAGVFWLGGICRLTNLIPITINGIGVFEVSMVYFINILGVPKEITLAATLVTRSITWILSLTVVLWILGRKYTLKKCISAHR